MKFNHLTVISFAGHKNKNNNRYWLCECDCENKTRKEIAENHLINGNTKSCGCLKKKHGMRYTRFYKIFLGMKKRCKNLL